MGSWDCSNREEVLQQSKQLRNGDSGRQTHISDLPVAVLTSIFSLVADPRTRNCMSLICRDWYYLERQTRSSLTLRGNFCNLLSLPHSFKNVAYLDLSYCSPWGYSVFQSTTEGELVGRLLQEAFPNVKDLAIYVRDAADIQMVVCFWPELESLRLVRWHKRATEVGAGLDMGSEVGPLLKCEKLRRLDLSAFYCWTEDILPALESGTAIAANLLSLNLLKISPEGFKTQEIVAITAACKNLEELFVRCEFDPKFLDSVGDKALEAIGSNCPRMRILHLVDNYEWDARCCDLDDGPAAEDANVSSEGLEVMARQLPQLQNLALLFAQNLWDSGPALEALFTHCTKLTSLQLSHFHGVCLGPEEDGLARGTNLTELSLKNSVDLSDLSLASISRGCKKLKKLSLKGCREISERGVNDCVRALSQTLVDVEILCCAHLPSFETLRALEPIRNSIQRLHVDCVWDEAVVTRQAAVAALRGGATSTKNSSNRQGESLRAQMTSRNQLVSTSDCDNRSSRSLDRGNHTGPDTEGKSEWASTSQEMRQLISLRDKVGLRTRCENGDGGRPVDHFHNVETSGCGSNRHVVEEQCSSICSLDYCVGGCSHLGQTSSVTGFKGDDAFLQEQAPDERCWSSLETLSLWIGVGLLISPLPSMGLGQCPLLKEVSIKVEGDCKSLKRPAVREWGLATFSRYKSFTKLNMDLGEVVSFSLSAPEGQVDLSIWERHYLSGIDQLQLRELDYRPPCDKDLDHRGLSLPAVGHLSQCQYMRKLIVHGSAHEHFLSMLHWNTSLRDFQLLWDFYPAPECETSTEVRVEACKRFEAALAVRGFPD